MVPGDVEFLHSEPAPDSDDDLLNNSPGPLPRRLLVIVGVLVVALAAVGVVLAHRQGSGSHAGSAAASSQPPVPTAAPVGPQGVHPVPPAPLDGTLIDLGAAPVLTVGMAGPRVAVLQDGRLSLVDPRTGADLRWAAVQTAGAFDGTTFQLVADAPASRLWLVDETSAYALAREFDMTTLRQLRQVRVRGGVQSAAAQGGRLYLGTLTGLVELGGGAPRLLLAGRPTVATGDPARHRVLAMVNDGTGAGVVLSGGGKVAGLRWPATVAGTVKGTLTVVAGQLWVAGFGRRGAVLERLNPAGLRPRGASPLAPYLGPGAVLVGTGQRVLWVTSAGGGGDLWCVDAHDGAVLRHWSDVSGAVASVVGTAVAVNGVAGQVMRLHLGRCTG
jgi:hypothetical protein